MLHEKSLGVSQSEVPNFSCTLFLYEKKKTLPSKFSLDHKYFFTVDEDDPPHTLGLIPLIEKCLSNYKIIYAKVCNEGCTITDPNIHSNGEYSIEVVIKKSG